MGVFIVFDLTSKISFDSIRNWNRQVKKNTDENIQRWLLGNKADLKDERAVLQESIKEICEELEMKYLEVSAKTGDGVNTAFMNMSRDIKNKFFPKNAGSTEPQKTGLKLKADDEASTSKGRSGGDGCGC
jgi:GTPase SAR1 family protein